MGSLLCAVQAAVGDLAAALACAAALHRARKRWKRPDSPGLSGRVCDVNQCSPGHLPSVHLVDAQGMQVRHELSLSWANDCAAVLEITKRRPT